MEIEGTTFGTITINGKTYEHDVIIRRSGEVVKRKKKLSKKYYGTSHVLSKDEAKFVFEPGCEQLILGSGQMSSSLIQVTVVPVFTVTRSGAKANWSMCTSLVGAEPSAQSGGMSRWLCQWLGDCTPVSPRGRRARSPRSARAQAAGLMLELLRGSATTTTLISFIRPRSRSPKFALSITVMAITKCLIWVLTVNRFTAAQRAVSQGGCTGRSDGSVRWLDGEDHEQDQPYFEPPARHVRRSHAR